MQDIEAVFQVILDVCVLSGPDDHPLTVAFGNGRTEKVVMSKAIWIPQPVYERVSLELKMPRDTRSTIMTTDHYPIHNLPGYPISGPQATPPEFYTPENFSLEPNTFYNGWDRWVYPEYLGYYPPYPLVVRRKQEQREKELATAEEDTVIPGTDMTRKQLDERIMSQLSEHSGAESSTQQMQSSSRLLKKRDKLEENTLKKSVTFNESDLIQVAPETELKSGLSDSRGDADSGIASSPELDIDPVTQERLDRIEEEKRWIAMERLRMEEERRFLEEEEKRIAELQADPRLQFYRSPGVGRRPPWRYWRNDPSPGLPGGGGSGGGGGGVKSSKGGFRETALQAPLEVRDQKRSPVTGSGMCYRPVLPVWLELLFGVWK